MKKINIILFSAFSGILFLILLTSIIIALIYDNSKYYIDISKYNLLTDVESDKDTYLLMPYTANYDLSNDEEENKNTQKMLNEMLNNVKECQKKYNIGFYLVDFAKFGRQLQEKWSLTKLPAYYVFTKENGKNVYLYSGYGVKTAYELQDEINKVIKYDLPVNDIGDSRTINDALSVVLYSYTFEDEEKKQATITLDFNFSELIEYDIQKGNFEILDYMSKEKCAEVEEIIVPETLNTNSNDIKLKIKVIENCDLEHITIKYNINSDKYVMWHYNKWIIESES